MREEPSQLIYHDKSFQRITLSIGGPEASCLVCRYKCLLWRRGGWFGQRPEAFNVPFAQQEAQTNTWQRVTALWPWLELSDHHTRKYCIPCLRPCPEITTQKVDPQLQERKITLGTFCLCWEAHQFVAFILLVWGPREKMSLAMGLAGLGCPHRGLLIVSPQSSSWHSLTFLWKVVTHILSIPWTRGQCLIHFCILGVWHSDWLKEGSVTVWWMNAEIEHQGTTDALQFCLPLSYHISQKEVVWKSSSEFCPSLAWDLKQVMSQSGAHWLYTIQSWPILWKYTSLVKTGIGWESIHSPVEQPKETVY